MSYTNSDSKYIITEDSTLSTFGFSNVYNESVKKEEKSKKKEDKKK